MADYKKMYLHLFNKVTDALEDLDKISAKLKQAQQECEDIYIETAPYYEDTGDKIVALKTDSFDIE